MRLARPPGGFKITLAPAVRKLIDDRCKRDQAFVRHWNDITDRLRFTAHVEGVADERFGAGHRLWAAEADEDRGLPRVRLVYLVLGDSVRIRVAQVG